jgi:hypothetical protein
MINRRDFLKFGMLASLSLTGCAKTLGKVQDETGIGMLPPPSVRKTMEPVKKYSFGELWRQYLDVQTAPGLPVGKSPDFAEYCTRNSNTCGFNEKDKDFNRKFHGNFVGYNAIKDDEGNWWYVNKDTVSTSDSCTRDSDCNPGNASIDRTRACVDLETGGIVRPTVSGSGVCR